MPKEKIQDYWWLRPSDFEVRCDAFVNEITQRVIPKYPNLEIEVENYTKEELAVSPKMITAAKGFRNGAGLLKRMRSEDRWKEQQSATENEATVEIKGIGLNSTVIIAQAVGDIADIAEIHRGRRVQTPGYSVDEDLLNLSSPGIFLKYIFS